MRRVTLFIACILGFYGVAQSQNKPDTLAHTLLWKITRPDLPLPSYLYGTMHTGDDKVFRLTDSTLNAFDAAQVFAMEINMDSVDQVAMAMQMKLPGDQSLKELLGENDYKLVGKYTMKQAGIPIFLLNTVKPLYVFLLIMQGKPDKKDDVLDMYYFKLAKKEKKQVIGLEKDADQLKLLDNIPIDKQVVMLREGIHHFKEMQASMKETESDTSMGANFMQDFIIKRNRVMANGMEKVIRRGSSLFTAVGAAHLPGKDGIISLLRKDGFTVTPVISETYLKAKDVKRKVKG